MSIGRTHRIGFARRELNQTKRLPVEQFLEPLEVRCFVVETDTGLACWLVFDLTCLYIEHCSAIREEVARVLGCTPALIVVHCTHTHSVPDLFLAFPVELLVKQAAGAAREAQAQLQPFSVVETCVDIGNRFSIMRRKCLPGIGAFTVYFGYRLENGRPDGAALIREHAERLFGPRHAQISELTQPIWFDDPIDPLVHGMAFVGKDGKVIGSLLRFSAHPHITVHVEQLLYHPDFPGFARNAMEREMGGLCLYLTGPCGDIVPKEDMQFRMPSLEDRPAEAKDSLGSSYWHKEVVPAESVRVARHLGENLARLVLARLLGEAKPESHRWTSKPTEPGLVRAQTIPLAVPIRKDYASSSAQASAARDAALERFRELRRHECSSLWQLRALADQVQQCDFESLDIRSLPAGARESGSVTLDMGLLQLGDVLLAGLPSEPLVGTSHRLRANTIGSRLWTISFSNGWIGYMPGSLDRALGGYEGARTPLPPDGLIQYETQACSAIQDFMRS